MGPGHFGVGLLAKLLAPEIPTPALLAAGGALDFLHFGLLTVGIEKAAVTQVDLTNGLQVLQPGYFPWSHGLMMSVAWSLLAAGMAWWVSRNRRISAVIGLVVFSHWLLDFLVHPALPIFINGPQIGLRLWTSGPGFIVSGILDVGLFVAGVVVAFVWRKRK